jgi:hypothetical protein
MASFGRANGKCCSATAELPSFTTQALLAVNFSTATDYSMEEKG